MVSAVKYVSLVEAFFAKYKTLLSSAMKRDILAVTEWVLNYKKSMAGETQEKIVYLKRGANLMKRFVAQYEHDSKDMNSKLVECRSALLRGDVKNIPSWCTEKSKDKLLAYDLALDVFTSQFIGCADGATDYFLEKLKQVSKLLGDEYMKIESDIKLTCLHLAIVKLKR